jgi:uncharacterized membrane protein
MLSVYPYAEGSLFTASYAASASVARTARIIYYATTASTATSMLALPISGSRGKSACLLTFEQYQDMVAANKMEICTIPNYY